MRILGVIPARFQSTRYPGKPLIDILGKSMIQRVYEQAIAANLITDVYIATDDDRIMTHCKTFTDKVLMTNGKHINGTERCNEVLAILNKPYDFVVNIQGDEPFIHPAQINQVARMFINNPIIEIATLIKKIKDKTLLENPGVVKVVGNMSGEIMYFSRALIPFPRNIEKENWMEAVIFYKHIGIYGYRKDILQKIAILQESPLEKVENLEQLRWMENGYKIHSGVTEFESKSIDTPDDLVYVLQQLKLHTD